MTNVNPTVTKQTALSAIEMRILIIKAVRILSKLFKLAFLGKNNMLTIKPGTKKNKATPITSRNTERITGSI